MERCKEVGGKGPRILNFNEVGSKSCATLSLTWPQFRPCFIMGSRDCTLCPTKTPKSNRGVEVKFHAL
jgi:hypothetical protein